MNSDPHILVKWRVVHKPEGAFVIEKWEGRSSAVIYGPMPEGIVEQFLKELEGLYHMMADRILKRPMTVSREEPELDINIVGSRDP